MQHRLVVRLSTTHRTLGDWNCVSISGELGLNGLGSLHGFCAAWSVTEVPDTMRSMVCTLTVYGPTVQGSPWW